MKLVETRLVVEEQAAHSAPLEAGPAGGGWGTGSKYLPNCAELQESGPQGLAGSGRCGGLPGTLPGTLPGIEAGGIGCQVERQQVQNLMTRGKLMFYRVW